MLTLGLLIGFGIGALSVVGYRWYCERPPRGSDGTPFGPLV